MNSYGPDWADDYSPGCQPGVWMENEINSEGVTEETMASTLTNLLVHAVLSTKRRESMINDKYREVINYIENRAEHQKSKTLKEELIEILGKHGVDYDPKYLWD